jgi:hypothetical protein
MATWKTYTTQIGQGDKTKVLVNMDLVTHVVKTQETSMLVFMGDTHLPVNEHFDDLIKEYESKDG